MDSRPVQRMRHIKQLSLTSMVYSGATHTRFEHSLGVMHLAGQVFDAITSPMNVSEDVRDLFPEMMEEESRLYWRRVLRMAALCHDVGHLPFSHGPEDLFPKGWNHERLSREHILSDEMKEVWNSVTPPLRPVDVARVALEPSKDNEPSDWLDILSEIITGDAFGVDRIDYLLRDSLHAGVAYGRFDHLRLLGTLRILRQSPTDPNEEDASVEPTIGIEQGGIQAAESLAMARYLMFSQLYLHPVRRIYDIHLKDFLSEWLPQGKFPIELQNHLKMSDHQVLSAMESIAGDVEAAGRDSAQRILYRRHYKKAYELSLRDTDRRPDAFEVISAALIDEFGDAVRADAASKSSPGKDFPVKTWDGTIASSLTMSTLLTSVPSAHSEVIYCDPVRLTEAKRWLDQNINHILDNHPEEAAQKL